MRQYLLYLKNEKGVSRQHPDRRLCGIKFLYQHTLQREWHLLDFMARASRNRTLPAVLSVEEVQRVLGCVHQATLPGLSDHHLCLRSAHSAKACTCRWRTSTAAARMLHVRKGKGGQDRYVPLPQATLEMLRTYWRTHRHPLWLFPARPLRAKPSRPSPSAGDSRAA